jgi:hypothetical protein
MRIHSVTLQKTVISALVDTEQTKQYMLAASQYESPVESGTIFSVEQQRMRRKRDGRWRYIQPLEAISDCASVRGQPNFRHLMAIGCILY